eukprot:5211636-Alexandrium_andersonii.AAC.1
MCDSWSVADVRQWNVEANAGACTSALVSWAALEHAYVHIHTAIHRPTAHNHALAHASLFTTSARPLP